MKNSKIIVYCLNCKKELSAYPSEIKSGQKKYCSKSCSASHRNKYIYNPSWFRDVSGDKNPMYGKGGLVGEKNPMYGKTGEDCPNWTGGLHKRKDGYYRINIEGKRVLYHRHVLEENGIELKPTDIVHHIDHNPSNNDINNLMVFKSQAEHVKYECNSKSS